MVRCGRCGREPIDNNFMEAFDGWNWLYVCGRGEIRDCTKRAKQREEHETIEKHLARGTVETRLIEMAKPE